MRRTTRSCLAVAIAALTWAAGPANAKPVKPVLHGQHWVAVTGKPLAATAGARIFMKGGNAVDAACAMIAATSTMWDTLGWGGETQALIYNPHTKKVIGVNALGVAPTGATPEFFKGKGYEYPPEFGPLAAVTPGTPGGIMVMLAEYGKLSLAEVLAPSIDMADGYPIEEQAANTMERWKDELRKWPESRKTFLVHENDPAYKGRAAPEAGEIFRQPELAATLRKLVETEAAALKAGKSRKDAIMAAYDRFYKGDIAKEFSRGARELGGLHTEQDLANWRVHLEEPVTTNYRGVDVYKLTHWVQGPAMLQALNILENFDLKSMGYNSSRYIHTVYQAMNLAFADRDFYYGDPAFPPEEPIKGLLSKDYAKERAKLIRDDRNDMDAKPGDPYPFQKGRNPYTDLLQQWHTVKPRVDKAAPNQWSPVSPTAMAEFDRTFRLGTTSVEAADKEGWVVSVTPSGGWIPAVIAGKTGIGMSQRMQSFVLDPAENPFNVVAPGKRPRATLTPSLALKDGKPLLAFAVQGGDTQDQNLLQFFLNFVEFGMNVQESAEGANITSYQMRDSFGAHESFPGRLTLTNSIPAWVRADLQKKGYKLEFVENNSGPVTAIFLDQKRGTMAGAAAWYGEDYGIAW
ncbi:gamma-glutamyltranspeptidase/glutathione hydrolase [Povalibacter uvarum]|uniref:Gamma-glutamyltranspeptidase/glutathione hydrolase n=1 Tax=Povalibacter uvarum TaxID=732238 RepID=A0A841HKB7_9GAMM|nr:gamma-glutamyltransferase [Povalibacter uvarum]MBB6093276.1 gamma-glutamyltranspeptidase/glutathione hydrolase [Povalibacter uvarum]